MSGQPHDANATIGHAAGSSLSEQFEVAWQNALKGGRPPTFQRFLSQVSDEERATLQEELTRIDGEYRPRYAQYCSLAAAAVLNSTASPPTDPAITATSGTITVLPQAPSDPNATVDTG